MEVPPLPDVPGDRYRVEACVGQGGQSHVYRAVRGDTGALVALKVLSPDVDPALGRTLLRREFAALASISHPGVVEVLEFSESQDGRPFFAMEWIEGEPMTSYLQAAPRARLIDVLLCLLDALDAVHRRNILHGDVKPANVLVSTPEGEGPPRVTLLDLGMATVTEHLEPGAIRGSVHYLAPEVIRGAPADGRADLYSLGATLYEVLSGHPLWAGEPPETVLRKHLDVEPPPLKQVAPQAEPALRRIVERLLQKDPRLRYPTAHQVRVDLVRSLGGDGGGEGWVGPPVLAPTLVGRDVLLSVMLACVEQGVSGAGAVLMVQGAGGLGRTRLVTEVGRRAGLLGARAVEISSSASPLSMWRTLAQVLGVDSEGAVAELLPGDDEEVKDLDVAGRQVRLYERATAEIREVLGREGAQPVVVIFDDLDRAGAATRELVRFLARQVARLPLVLVASVGARAPRSEFPEPAQWFELKPLSMTQTGLLAASMLRCQEIPPELASLLHDESGGNPAEAQDFVRALVDEGTLTLDPDGRLSVSERGLQRAAERVSDWVERLVRSATPEAQAVLSVAGLLPEPLDAALLTGVMGFSEEQTFELLAELEASGALVHRKGTYVFSSIKLRRHVRGKLSEGSRRDLADRIARAIPERGGRLSDAQLGAYLEQGHAPQAAIPHLLAASHEAYGALALTDAVAFLKRAVALIISDPEGIDPELLAGAREQLADRLADAGEVDDATGIYDSLLSDVDESSPALYRVGVKLAKLHQRLGQYDAAVALLRRVLQTLDRHRDAARISELLARLSWIHKTRGALGEAARYAGRALKAARESGQPVAVANALNHQGAIAYNKGEFELAERRYREALTALVELEDAPVEGLDQEILNRAHAEPIRARVIANNLGNVHWKRGEWEQAIRFYGVALELAERVGDLSGIATAANNRGLIQFGRGDWDAAIAGFERALAIKRKLGEAAGVGIGLNNLAEVYERIGRWSDAREFFREAFEVKSRLDDTKGAGLVLLTLGNLYRKMGQLEQAAQEVQRGFQLIESCGDEPALAYAHYYQALLAKDSEQFVEALTHISESIAIQERTGSFYEAGRVYTSAADLHFRMGDLETASEFAQRSLALAEQLGDRFEKGKILSVLGRIHHQRRDRGRAQEAFEEGMATLEGLGARFELGRSAYEFGVRMEDGARASRYLEKAVGIFRSIGAVVDLERATGTLERIRESMPRDDASRPMREGLFEIGKLLNSSLQWERVTAEVLDVVLRETRAHRGLILVRDDHGDLQLEAARNIARESLDDYSEISESIVQHVLESQGPIRSSNAGQDPRFSANKSIALHGIVSIAAVPLKIRDRIAGVIYLDHLSAPDFFTSSDLVFLQGFADQAAIALENARLYRELQESSDRLAAENRVLRAESRPGSGMEIIGTSGPFRQVITLLEKAAATGATTLLLGESGTGKSFLARAIHDLGPRREGPFVKFNCAALPESLVESELFGHEKGAFTGADRRKLGRFEIANGGTIFLDEMGTMPLPVQAKLLRVIEDKEFERVGGTQTQRSNAQIVAATNRDLERAVREGGFREDLFFRLNVFPISIPPLRERRQDISLLAERFLAGIPSELGTEPKAFSPEALELIVQRDWPGNVRELASAVRRAAVMAGGEIIQPEDLRWLSGSGEATPRRELLLEEAVGAFVSSPRHGEKMFQVVTENVERVLIKQVLADCNGQIREASRRLGVARNTLRSKMKRYGLGDEG